MRRVRDKADSCRNYRWIKHLLLLRVRIVIAYQELQRTNQNVFSIIIDTLYAVHENYQISERRHSPEKYGNQLWRKVAI